MFPLRERELWSHVVVVWALGWCLSDGDAGWRKLLQLPAIWCHQVHWEHTHTHTHTHTVINIVQVKRSLQVGYSTQTTHTSNITVQNCLSCNAETHISHIIVPCAAWAQHMPCTHTISSVKPTHTFLVFIKVWLLVVLYVVLLLYCTLWVWVKYFVSIILMLADT